MRSVECSFASCHAAGDSYHPYVTIGSAAFGLHFCSEHAGLFDGWSAQGDVRPARFGAHVVSDEGGFRFEVPAG